MYNVDTNKHSDEFVKKVFSIFERNYELVPLEVFTKPYEVLISTLMSSRTKDEVTLEAANRLFKLANTPQKMIKLSHNQISKVIYPVGFYRVKAKNIAEVSTKLIKNFESTVPKTREELMTLPGVGRKTANLVLNRAYDIPTIAVDTHVHRIANLLDWVDTKTPRETEEKLEEIIDQKYWSEINRLFVSIGRRYGTGKKLVEFLKNNQLVS